MPWFSKAYQITQGPEWVAQLRRTYLHLGYHPETGDDLYVHERDRYPGMYWVGVQGVGKTSGLEGLVHQDAVNGHAIIVMEPHDMVKRIIGSLPAHRLPHTYWLNILVEEWPYGIIVFAVGKLVSIVGRPQTVDRLAHIFEVVWPEVRTQAHLPQYLRAATLTLLANPGSTLVDMDKLLTDRVVRARMLTRVTDQSVREFWQRHDSLSPSEQSSRPQALLNRLNALFMGRDLVKNIVGQSVNTINFRRVIENKEIILISLPSNLGDDARLIGTMLLARINAALFSFADLPEEQRSGFSLFIDEAQRFTTPDFAQIFVEGRKFHIRACLAHQARYQLPDFLQSATMTARSKVCFQLTPEDGREMAHLFPSNESTVKYEDITNDAVHDLLQSGSDDPHTQVFIEQYLLPFVSHPRKRGEIVIFNGGTDFLKTMGDMWGGEPTDLLTPDPTMHLNVLLRDAMRTGSALMPIARDIPKGFANCGRGFFAAARSASNEELSAAMIDRMPAHLVIQNGDGTLRWTRKPETSREQFYHFLFHLRMTMVHLAASPIGKATAASTADVAKMLTALPPRAAFVRSGEDIGPIYTNDSPPQVPPNELAYRLQGIQHQTRGKYCRPRGQVEWSLSGIQEATKNVTVAAPLVDYEEI
jgi:hypothetical protein